MSKSKECSICYINEQDGGLRCEECGESICVNCYERMGYIEIDEMEEINYKSKCPYCRRENKSSIKYIVKKMGKNNNRKNKKDENGNK